MCSPNSSLGWTINRNAFPAFGLLIIGLFANGKVHSDASRDGTCPGLALYKSQPYATEKDIRRRCDLLREIESGGRVLSPPLRDRMLDELSNRFAVEIDFTGAVALPAPAVDYLLENMPEAAVLVSTYTDKEYTATQAGSTPGPESFFVTNSRTFAASFTYLISRESETESEYMFFESGHAKVLFWTVWGNSFVRYTLRENDKETARYDIKIHVFTDSRLLRMVLKSGPFRYFAERMFKSILSDIESAVHEFADDSNPGERLPSYFVTGLKSRLL